MKFEDGLLQAIEIVGGKQSNLAKKINVSAPRLNQWLNGTSSMPLCCAQRIVEVTNGLILLESLTGYLNFSDREVILRRNPCAEWFAVKQIQLTNIKIPSETTDSVDIKNLAKSIQYQELVRPILLDESFKIIDGYKRFLVCKLNEDETIPARIINIEYILKTKDTAFLFRKFTHSEKVAVGIALEKYIGERRGRKNPDNCQEYKGKETSAIVAKKIDYGSSRTYLRARNIIKNGIPLLINLVDEGYLSIAIASVIATLSVDQQTYLLSCDFSTISSIVASLRKKSISNRLRKTENNEEKISNSVDAVCR